MDNTSPGSAGLPGSTIQSDGKLRGYAGLSTYMSLWSELAVVRRFGALHYRNLLYLQDEILEIERSLAERDGIRGLEHGSRRRDQDPVRAGLMRQLREKLQQYGKRANPLGSLLRIGRC